MRAQLAQDVHAANIKWWQDIYTGEPLKANFGEKLMLVVSELSEALEGHRKDLQDDKLPHRKMLEVELADAVIRLLDTLVGFDEFISEYEPSTRFRLSDNVGDMLFQVTERLTFASFYKEHNNKLAVGMDLCRAIDMVEDMCKHLNLDLWGAYEEKMKYNATRHDHTIEGRLAVGGKRF